MTGLVEVLIVASGFCATVIGLYIGYHAYRGFRRHDSPPMRYLAAGLVLLTAVAYTTAFFGSVLIRQGVVPIDYRQPLELLVRVLQLGGLALIAYSLYRR